MKKILFLIFLIFSSGFCEIRNFKVDFYTGYGFAKIQNPKNYEFYTLMVDFTRPIKNSKNFFYQIEPYVSYVFSPADNFEIGVSGFLLYKFSDSNFQPYLKVGTGIIYLSSDFVEQSTHFNFASSVSFGVRVFLKKVFLNTEIRLRHVSNAGIKLPNEGINSKLFLIGIGSDF
ncbi:MAG TPA: acyloxyacyl hydrolase [bacterium]|nr:acyloxyacyl hydrolase [bacterium]HOM25897.1 acyloxyacyl hydrolase [bacterium]